MTAASMMLSGNKRDMSARATTRSTLASSRALSNSHRKTTYHTRPPRRLYIQRVNLREFWTG